MLDGHSKAHSPVLGNYGRTQSRVIWRVRVPRWTSQGEPPDQLPKRDWWYYLSVGEINYGPSHDGRPFSLLCPGYFCWIPAVNPTVSGLVGMMTTFTGIPTRHSLKFAGVVGAGCLTTTTGLYMACSPTCLHSYFYTALRSTWEDHQMLRPKVTRFVGNQNFCTPTSSAFLASGIARSSKDGV